MKKILFALIMVVFLLSIVLYPSLPEQIPTHWNAQGQIDAYSAKSFGLFFIPGVLIFLFAMYIILPKIEVFRKNLEQSIKQFDRVFLALFLFFMLIYAATIFAAMGYDVKMTYLMMFGIGVLFYWIGHEIKHIKRNFFFGIRSPWALSSDHVWKKTHEFGSVAFRINAVVILFAGLVERWAFLIFIISVLLNALIVTIYSYYAYVKNGRKTDLGYLPGARKKR